MLATLNLQLLPVELLGDTPLTDAGMVPDAAGEPASGFADLLQLRVEPSLPLTDISGEILPASGNELPTLPGGGPADAGVASLPQPGSETDGPANALPFHDLAHEPDTAIETVDLSLDSAVLYPPVVPAVVSHATVSAVAAVPEAIPASLTPGSTRTTSITVEGAIHANAAGRGTSATESIRHGRLPDRAVGPVPAPPAIEASEARIAKLAAQVAVPVPVGPQLRERGRTAIPVPRAMPAVAATTTIDATQRMPWAEGARQLEPMPLSPGAGRPELPVVPSAGNPGGAQWTAAVPPANVALPTPANPAAIAPALAGPPAADTAYVAVASQGSELIATSVGDATWGDKLADRVLLLAGKQLRHAEIRLTPAELGPLRVQVSVDEGAAHVTFHAQHPVTRDALEQALPRLREMLAENGLSLEQADISDRHNGGDSREPAGDGRGQAALHETAHDTGIEAGAADTRRAIAADSLIDTFA